MRGYDWQSNDLDTQVCTAASKSSGTAQAGNSALFRWDSHRDQEQNLASFPGRTGVGLMFLSVQGICSYEPSNWIFTGPLAPLWLRVSSTPCALFVSVLSSFYRQQQPKSRIPGLWPATKPVPRRQEQSQQQQKNAIFQQTCPEEEYLKIDMVFAWLTVQGEASFNGTGLCLLCDRDCLDYFQSVGKCWLF